MSGQRDGIGAAEGSAADWSGLDGAATRLARSRPDPEEFRLLLSEMRHRSRNLVSVVQSIIQVTEASSTAEFKDKVGKRIAALEKVHSLLGAGDHDGADLLQLVQAQVAPFSQDGHVRLSGGAVFLTPRAAQSIAMVLHELSTNAAKYGALSAQDGRISIQWHVQAGRPGHLVLQWVEEGGPPAATPRRSGFGSKVVKAMMATLMGSIEQDWRPEGLSCTLHLPLDQCARPGTVGPETLPAAPPSGRRNIVAGRKVFVFETDPIVAMAFRRLFELMDCTLVGPVTRQSEAVEMARTASIDLAIVDSGFDGGLCEPIIRELAARSIPFVVSTCNHPASLIARLTLDAVFLPKPFGFEALAATLERAMRMYGSPTLSQPANES